MSNSVNPPNIGMQVAAPVAPRAALGLKPAAEKVNNHAPALITGAVISAAVLTAGALMVAGAITFPVSGPVGILAVVVGVVALLALGIISLVLARLAEL